jgi:hypothetical protein
MDSTVSEYYFCVFYKTDKSELCGAFDGRKKLFTTDELQSTVNYIEGTPVSDFELLKSRTKYCSITYICPRHRNEFCQNYQPEPICKHCSRNEDLKKIGVRAANFLGWDPPICECYISRH